MIELEKLTLVNGSVRLFGLQDMAELLAKQTGDYNDFLNT